ncbi:MAG: bifunctional homocysteine S-methyltransferase/methylenetetrahydrofolate reductase [Kiritimatiellaeota bacterium]|nr:bifunctional homocysteine S-methyltransferase/methylenetetrahydrofolate reductase [Kiritimatiellota bacterium]
MTLLERLAHAPLIGDGATGTYLHELGFDLRDGPEQLSLTAPDAIHRAHAAYLDAGADLIETNTFAANRFALAATPFADRTRDLIRAAVQLAKNAAAQRNAWVAGAVGPATPPDDEEQDPGLLTLAYREQFETLCDCGVDALLLETFEDWHLTAPAVQAALDVAGTRVPVFVNMVFADGFTTSGETAQTIAHRLSEWGVAGVGMNCGRGIEAVSKAVAGLLEGAADCAYVGAFPNAGYPTRIGGRTVYLATPSYIAKQSAEWAAQGVRLIGGCCGTTPDTIRAIAQAVSGMRKIPAPRVTYRASSDCARLHSTARDGIAPPPPPAKQGGFLDAIRDTAFPVIAEIDPPPHLDLMPMLTGARALLDAGASAISLAENPLSSIRMENFYVAERLRRETGKHVICHITGRDRNMLGTQSALMAAHAAHIEAILAVTGDPPVIGGHRRCVAVYENTSTGLVRLLTQLNAGRSVTGRDLRGQCNFSIGVAFNSAAANLGAEVVRLRRKHAEGARFVMTQPVFDLEQARRVLDALSAFPDMRVFLGFLPPVTERLARHLHDEVPGIRLPDAFLQKLFAFADPADQERFAIDETHRLITALRPALHGLYLITPGIKWQAIAEILRNLS